MFQGRFHKNYVAIQAAVQAAAGNVQNFGTADFWYDASQGQFFSPAGLSSGGTVTAWTSKFTNGTVVPVSGFGPTYGGGAYSLPNFYFVGTNAQNPTVATLSYSIAPGTASTCTAYVTTQTNRALSTLNIISAPTNSGAAVGYVVTGGTIPAGTYIYSNISGTSNSTTSSWTLTVPQGTTQIAQNTATFTITPVVMTVTSATGIINVGGMVYKATGGPTANTFVTAQGTGNGGTGTYYVNLSQTNSATGATQFLPFVAMNSGDAFRVPMNASDRVISGYTAVIAYKWGTTTGHVSMMGSTHGNGGDFSWGNNAGVHEYNVAGATATATVAVSATGWHVHTLVYDGTQTGNDNRFKVYYDGTLTNLTFSGTVGSSTTAPAAFTCTVSAAAYNTSTDIMVLTYPTTGSPAWVAGDSITVAGLTPATTTDSVFVNGVFTVTSCTTATVSYSVVSNGTYTRTSGGTVTGVPIPNLMVAGKAPIASATKNTNPVAATQGINIGELIVYGSALGSSQIAALNKLLKNKWLGTN